MQSRYDRDNKEKRQDPLRHERESPASGCMPGSDKELKVVDEMLVWSS